MRRSLTAAIFLVALTFSFASAFAAGPSLTGEMAAKKIVTDEENREIAVPAEQVYPEDTVEYTLIYRNSGDAAASGVDLVGPVPSGTVYLDGTAMEIDGMDIVYSIDAGKTYHQAPVMYEHVGEDGEVQLKEATPDMITHIKWSMEEPFEAGSEVTVSYRVQVK